LWSSSPRYFNFRGCKACSKRITLLDRTWFGRALHTGEVVTKGSESTPNGLLAKYWHYLEDSTGERETCT
jgi:hypothetical protein